MAAQFGAHEMMEVHEVLSCAIDSINQFQLYRAYCKDPQLMSILDNQLNFMTQEYNGLVQMIGQKGLSQAVPYRAPKNINPVYGLRNPGANAPNAFANEMDDRDVSSCMLGTHKASAAKKMLAALECADPQLRRMLQQGAINCSEQAYEVWNYMNQKGYYQVPTLKDVTTDTMIGTYASTNMAMGSGLAQQNNRFQ